MKTARLVILIVNLHLIAGSIINATDSISVRLKRQSSGGCNFGQFRCKDGTCIEDYEKCDGYPHCEDGSDETVSLCRNANCPDSMFQCGYGACINEKSVCDGEKDCVDNSDEILPNCKSIKEARSKRNYCNDGFSSCSTWGCIANHEVCNGVYDCLDETDEKSSLCSSKTCPPSSFVCAYGACVPESARCNGVRDCVDNSDESFETCGREPIPGPEECVVPNVDKATITNDAGTVLRPGQIVKHSERINYKCRDSRPDGQIGTHCLKGNFFTGIRKCVEGCPIITLDDLSIKPRCVNAYFNEFPCTEYVPSGTFVEMSCKPGYRKRYSFSEEIITCQNDGTWTGHTFRCDPLPTCPISSLETLTMKARCLDSNFDEVSCTEHMKPGSMAQLSCKVGYRKKNPFARETTHCQEDGTWRDDGFECESICGEIDEGHAFIAGGKEGNIAQVPWQVAIYQMNKGSYLQICGGTIISEKAVLTAAHCFWNGIKQSVNSPQLYAAYAGKTKRDYYAEEPKAQRLNIKRIEVLPQYTDLQGMYTGDIAVLVLEDPIIFQSYIKPVCLNFDLQGNDKFIPSGWNGRVAGWGLTENNTFSPVLKIVDLPTVDIHTCKSKSEKSFVRFVLSDKFCMGTALTENVCQGDSGGGFAIPSTENGTTKYFLRGLISVGVSSDDLGCAVNTYTTLTDVMFYSRLFYGYVQNLN